jgi:hypothetical protein
MTTHEVLVKARNLIGRDGWVQRDWGAPGGPRCAVGVISDSGGDGASRITARRAVAEAAGVEDDGWGGAVITWNNAPGRTKAEVLAAFDKAIAATAPEPPDPFEGTAQPPAADRRSPGRSAAEADNPKQPVHV